MGDLKNKFHNSDSEAATGRAAAGCRAAQGQGERREEGHR